MLIFWPDDARHNGWAYGWRLDGSQTICIAGIQQSEQVWKAGGHSVDQLRVFGSQLDRISLELLVQRLEEISRAHPFFGSPTVIGYVYFGLENSAGYTEIRLYNPITTQLVENL
jgi:hypothetical protein